MGKQLGALKPGQSGTVASIGGQGALHRHMLDMGFTPGTRVLVANEAPMGDPMEVRLRGYSITLRREDAMLIDLKDDE